MIRKLVAEVVEEVDAGAFGGGEGGELRGLAEIPDAKARFGDAFVDMVAAK